jgi:hypothetical protein
MMGQWNDGIVGFGKMEKWASGKVPLFHVRGRNSDLEKYLDHQ